MSAVPQSMCVCEWVIRVGWGGACIEFSFWVGTDTKRLIIRGFYLSLSHGTASVGMINVMRRGGLISDLRKVEFAGEIIKCLYGKCIFIEWQVNREGD